MLLASPAGWPRNDKNFPKSIDHVMKPSPHRSNEEPSGRKGDVEMGVEICPANKWMVGTHSGEQFGG